MMGVVISGGNRYVGSASRSTLEVGRMAYPCCFLGDGSHCSELPGESSVGEAGGDPDLARYTGWVKKIDSEADERCVGGD